MNCAGSVDPNTNSASLFGVSSQQYEAESHIPDLGRQKKVDLTAVSKDVNEEPDVFVDSYPHVTFINGVRIFY